MKEALLIGPVRGANTVKVLKRTLAGDGYVHIIAVDGGADLCREAEVIPTLYVGDSDSLSDAGKHYISQLEIERVDLPVDKNLSDWAIALDYLCGYGIGSLDALGFMGGRLDHQMALLGELSQRGIQAHLIGDKEELWSATRTGRLPAKVVVSGSEFSSFSVFGIGEGAVVSIDGARWPLEHRALEPLSSLGLSNEVAPGAFDARVLVEEGSVIVLGNSVS